MEAALAVTSGIDVLERLLIVLPGWGVDPVELCRSVGLDIERVRRHGRFSVVAETAIWRAAASRVTHIPLGVAVAQRCFDLGLHESSLYEYIGCFAPTLRNAAETMHARQRLETDALVTSVIEQADACLVRVDRVFRGVEVSFDRIEFGMVRMLKEARRLTSSDINPVRVLLRRPSGRHDEFFQQAFNAPVSFGADADTMAFSPDALDLRLPRANPELHAELVRIADLQLASLAPVQLWPVLVDAVERMLPDGDNSLEMVARRLGSNVGALEQLLQQRGQTWTEVVDGIRRPIAERLLRVATMAIATVGYNVGFSSPASFSKAFRRWTGKTPEEFRRSS
jgi:AraC-like DNA-binding protein